MSAGEQNSGEVPPSGAQAIPPGGPTLTLTITMTGDGNVNVTGPLQLAPICNYMVDKAKELILHFDAEAAARKASPIIVPTMVPPRGPLKSN